MYLLVNFFTNSFVQLIHGYTLGIQWLRSKTGYSDESRYFHYIIIGIFQIPNQYVTRNRFFDFAVHMFLQPVKYNLESVTHTIYGENQPTDCSLTG